MTTDPAEEQVAARDRTVRRQRVVIVIACIAAAIAIVALAASLFVKSPQQRAAEKAPPPKHPVTAPVRKGVLVSRVITRGTVEAADTVDVLAPSTATSAAQVVTAIKVKVGDTVKAGDAPIRVSGRPILIFQGKVPAYRALGPGDSGDDVKQLQRNLVKLGYLRDGLATGTFGSATGAAVTKLYHKLGLKPPHTWDANPSQRSDIDAAKRAVTVAERDVVAKCDAYEHAQGTHARAVALRELGYSRQDLADAKQHLADLQAVAGVQIPFGEAVFLDHLPAKVIDISTTVGADIAKAKSARVMRLSSSALEVRAVVPEGSQTGLKVGQSVKITDAVNRRHAIGKITHIGKFQAADNKSQSTGDQESGYPITVKPAKDLGSKWLGASVRVAVTTAKTKDKVLIVPVRAVVTSTNGDKTLTVVDAEGQRVVRVATGLVASGEVEVTPEHGDSLKAGDKVVVG